VCQAQNACMMLWLKTFCGIRWTVMSRSNELKTGLLKGDVVPIFPLLS